MKPPLVLVIDDKDSARALVRRILEPRGYALLEAASVPEAQDALTRQRVDMVLTDLQMPGCDGLEGITRLRAVDPDLPIVMITAFATVDSALQAMKSGAFDYLQKPVDPAVLQLAVDRAIAHRRLIEENKRLREELSGMRPEPRFIVRSAVMIDLLRLVERVAPTSIPVLIEGGSGTGKELIARRVHALSSRSHQKFLSINCAAIPDSLLESELFGHDKGAFSGATSARAGFFAEAEGGTLMLDEIGELSLALQPKLLRILQEGEYFPLGEHQPRRCDVRIICATNRDLGQQVQSGAFRSDLYYRIDHARLRIPPLSERTEDIPPLAEYYLERARGRFDTAAVRIAAEAMRHLLAYSWPGNVRELENVIERACLHAEGADICAADLPPEIAGGPKPVAMISDEIMDYRDARSAFESRFFHQLMQRADGNVATAARLANPHRATLYEKLTRYGIVK